MSSSRRSSLRGINKLVAARRFNEAEKAARKLIEAGGADLPLVNLYASVLQKQGKSKLSEAWFDRSLRNSPNQFHVLLDQAKNKAKLEKRQEASFLASKAAELSSGTFSDNLKIAETYQGTGNPASAIGFSTKPSASSRRAPRRMPDWGFVTVFARICSRLAIIYAKQWN